MKVAILIPCLDRHELLERSLYLLSRQTYPCDVFVIDDGSIPGIEEITLDANAYYERLRDPLQNPADARMPATALRHMYKQIDHEFVIISPPEVLVPLNAVESMLAQHQSPRRSTTLLYSISRPLMKIIDEYPWKENVHSLQEMPEFMQVYNRIKLRNYQMVQWRHHCAFTGQLREDWEIHDFMPDGVPDDAWLWDIEDELTKRTGIQHRVNPIDLIVYHQFHKVIACSPKGDRIWRAQNYGDADLPSRPNISAQVALIRRNNPKDENKGDENGHK